MKNIQSLLLIICLTHQINAQIPAGYYNSITTQTGAALKTALSVIITNGHIPQSYTPGLWTAYNTTDKKFNGKVWDMYSNCDFTFGRATDNPPGNQDSGGGDGTECQVYNREHSFPKSWFGNSSPSSSVPESVDLFHVVPTDKLVNAKRGSFPYGEVGSSVTYQSINGSKLGICSFPGFSSTVFEPIDEYKGDFARNYLYMATRYEPNIAGWEKISTSGDAVMNGTSFPCYEVWFVNLLAKWLNQDPVSQKEIDRNNAVYLIQKNRNPYIDNPQYASLVWGFTSTITGNSSVPGIVITTTPGVVITTTSTLSVQNITFSGLKNAIIRATISTTGISTNQSVIVYSLSSTGLGSLAINANSSITYIPPVNFIGTENRVFVACNSTTCLSGIITFNITESVSTNISAESVIPKLEIFPNPSENGIVNFNEYYSGIIYNNLGMEITKFNNVNSIDLSGQAKGLYYLKTTSKQGKKIILK